MNNTETVDVGVWKDSLDPQRWQCQKWGVLEGERGMTLENVGEHAQSGGGSRSGGSVAPLPPVMTYDWVRKYH